MSTNSFDSLRLLQGFHHDTLWITACHLKLCLFSEAISLFSEYLRDVPHIFLHDKYSDYNGLYYI